MKGDTLVPYQSLHTTGAYGLKHFVIGGIPYLAVASLHNGSTYKINSRIYKWNGKLFSAFQEIPTQGASDVTFFNKNGDSYLVFANYHDDSSASINSYIYIWQRGKFVKFQDIRTEGAWACEAFVIANQTYLAFANYYSSQQDPKVQSTVYRWSGGHFLKHQSLPTSGARDLHYFEVSGHSFLAVANYYSGSSHNTNSHLYKWDGAKFVIFQSILSRGGKSWNSLVISGDVFLVLANHHGNSQGYAVNSVVYKASGAQFVKYQELDTSAARGMCPFVYKDEQYLAVTNSYLGKNNINSGIYKWV